MIKKNPLKTVRIGLLGLGTVGSGVVRILKSHAASIEKKTGIRLVLKKVGVKNISKKRMVSVPRSILTDKPLSIVNDPAIDIFIELIGGVHPAKGLIEKAFQSGKHVVTANKALLAEEGRAIFAASRFYGKRIGFEASVCGGIPIIQSLKDGLASNNITHFLGIVNGTCNYILTAMSKEGVSFGQALKEAQAKGYAEKNPRLDVEGVDSAHKLAILARLAFRSEISFKSISVEGIGRLSPIDIGYAKELGYVIKLLAIGKKRKDGFELRVHPTLLPLDHPLSNVQGVYNAVFVHADQAGDLLFYGRGAGMMPTASAVMSDVIDIAKEMDAKAVSIEEPSRAHVEALENIQSKYYLRFQVSDKPGVLGRIAQTLGKNHISILSVHQKESHSPNSVPVVILTYAASEKDIRRALKAIDAAKETREKTVVLRVES